MMATVQYGSWHRMKPSCEHARTLVTLAMLTLTLAQCLPLVAAGADGPPSGWEMQPLAQRYPFWVDLFDDLSHVYVLPTGLAGVEVTDGEVRLQPGKSDGWVASSIITCPVGYRYDFIKVEALLPGDSYIEVSLLDASKESTVVGFANATIDGCVRMLSTEPSINEVDPDKTPRVRIQVDMHTVGEDMPRLLSWSLFFIGMDEWMDDFMGQGKMLESKGIRLDYSQASLDFAFRGTRRGATDYPMYPTVVFLPQSMTNNFYAFYANAERTTYATGTSVVNNYTYKAAFDDIDGDGYVDMVQANYADTAYSPEIWWGTSAGTLSSTGCTKLPLSYCVDVDTGDLNGDGWPDIALSGYGSGKSSAVYLADGFGDFPSAPDLWFPASIYVRIGDLDGDGYEDVVYASYDGSYYELRCYLGGSDGPDSTVDVTINVGEIYSLDVDDIDLDGCADIVCAGQNQQRVFLGGPDGPDTIADYSLTPSSGYGYRCAVGDVNGDKLKDLVFLSSQYINIFEGTASGWGDGNRHDLLVSSTSWALKVVDVNKDGYDDIVTGLQNYFEVYTGSSDWTLTRIVHLSNIGSPIDMVVAIPPKATARNYTGHIITKPIVQPPGKKWDMLDLDARLERNTTMRIAILDSSLREIPGFSNLTGTNVDISSIVQTTIHVRLDLSSELNTTTPRVDRLTVAWIDRMSWMERFYGAAKIERMLGLSMAEGALTRPSSGTLGPALVFASLRDDEGLAAPGLSVTDSGGLDYLSNPPMGLGAMGASGVDAMDIDGNGFMDLVFAVPQTSGSYTTVSPMFLGSATGWGLEPDHEFTTVGAREVLLRDLNLDGLADVVFAQETDGSTYSHPSVLFWGSASGFNATADLTFSTTGATDVEAADVDGDGRLDLVFACGRAASSSCDSMVFLQGASGFTGATPSHRLPTQSACSVAVADLDMNGRADILFANNFSTGTVEISSFIYWGRPSGGFNPTPTALPTVGAADVRAADLDRDSDIDIVFANHIDNARNYGVDSYVYLNHGGGSFGPTPDIRLPTTGASSVAIADFDGTGWLDLIFACERNATSRSQPSVIYTGGTSGYPASSDIRVATMGATDVVVVPLPRGVGGYLSEAISPEDASDTGGYNTLSYMASVGVAHDAKVRVLDAMTWSVLAETEVRPGLNEWRVAGLFRFREHPTVRVAIVVSGLDSSDDFSLDNIKLNWTKRTYLPPQVLGLDVSATQVNRGCSVELVVNVTDEFDVPEDLRVQLEHRLPGGQWSTYLASEPAFRDGAWRATFAPRLDTDPGWYDIKVIVVDLDGIASTPVEFPSLVQVLNNLPSAPVVRISPGQPTTDSMLRAEVVESSHDIESIQIGYKYRWYMDGMPMDKLTTDSVEPSLTTKGQNWSVEVRGYDGLDESSPGRAWTVIQNSAPRINSILPPLTLEEDISDSTTLNLANAFTDSDGDDILWRLGATPEHLTVDIDFSTGRVSVRPEWDWNGFEDISFIGSDGMLEAMQSVSVTVMAVNDAPRFASIDGQPIVGQPVRLTVLEDQTLDVLIDAFDVEDSELRFSCDLVDFEIDIRTGRLTFAPDNSDVGVYRLNVSVWEVARPDVATSLALIITVENVNDPMDEPRILSPSTGSLFKEDQTISLLGSCNDPDARHGQALNFTWSSDISGILGYGIGLTLRGIAPGNHTVTLTVRDSEYAKSTSILIDVEAIVTPPVDGEDDDTSVGGSSGTILLIVVVLVVVIVVLDVYLIGARRRREEPTSAPVASAPEAAGQTTPAMSVAPPPAAGVLPHVGGYALEEVTSSTMVWRPSPSSPSPGMAPPTYVHPPPPPTYQPPPPPSIAPSMPPSQAQYVPPQSAIGIPGMEAGEAAQAREHREVMRALTQLPQGLPTSLWGWDMTELSRAIVAAEKRVAPDGTEQVLIKGRWYNADRTNVGQFLRESKEPEAEVPAPSPADDRRKRLDKLEEALLEGKISEQTYMDLKAKYERR